MLFLVALQCAPNESVVTQTLRPDDVTTRLLTRTGDALPLDVLRLTRPGRSLEVHGNTHLRFELTSLPAARQLLGLSLHLQYVAVAGVFVYDSSGGVTRTTVSCTRFLRHLTLPTTRITSHLSVTDVTFAASCSLLQSIGRTCIVSTSC